MQIVRKTGLSALLATHNPELAAKMDREVSLQNGVLIEKRSAVKIENAQNFY